jgi:hypothetical protein
MYQTQPYNDNSPTNIFFCNEREATLSENVFWLQKRVGVYQESFVSKGLL